MIYGFAHLLDFEGRFDSYNQCPTPNEADAVAIYSDWSTVGDSLSDAMRQLAAG